ncbi:DUF4190 domain-containing protein [Streptomyces broussonetiae]|uniref:DUF4190 domain-containing protein n=1 Tax=Streptomyces broussonetiae TaxID=2686304 RepID=A0ABV5EK54_9ACTN
MSDEPQPPSAENASGGAAGGAEGGDVWAAPEDRGGPRPPVSAADAWPAPADGNEVAGPRDGASSVPPRDGGGMPWAGPRDGASSAAPRDGGGTPWASGTPHGPYGQPPRDADPRVPLHKGDDRGAALSGPGPERDPWAPPADDARPPARPSAPSTGDARPPAGPPSVHDQQTVTSMPGAGAGCPPPQPWSSPAAPPGPFVPPAHDGPGAANPFAPPAQDSPVPPPPIAPGGPGPSAYGYPGGYGHPAPPVHPAAPYQHGGYPGYPGWPGAAPMPSNGMGTAGLVLGIVATVLFCLWPLAFILGLLGVVFGAVGRKKASQGEASNGGQALAGIICGSVGMLLALGMAALVIFVP